MAIEQTGTGGNAASQGGKGNLPAVGFMLIAVVSFSLIPLVVELVGGSQFPFLFNAWFRVGISVGCLAFLAAFYRRAFQGKNRSIIVKWLVTWPNNRPIIWAIAESFCFLFFAWSVNFINITVAAILYETWPVFMILLTSWLFRDTERYHKVTYLTVFLILLSMAGFVLAIGSQIKDLDGLDSNFLWKSIVGVALVITGTILAVFSAFSFKWAEDLSKELQLETDSKSSELCCAVIAFLVASLASVAISWSMGTISDEDISNKSVIIVFASGAFTAIGAITLRKAHFTTKYLSIHAIGFATPVLSLLWLFLVPNTLKAMWALNIPPTEVNRWDYLIMGAAAIITANLLINFEAEVRLGFKSLVLSLGTFGAFVYLRNDIFDLLNVSQWNWTGAGYFQSITLSATVFILLLAFRVSRVVTRASDEDNRTFVVYRKLDMLARRKVINPQVCQYILDLDRADNNSTLEQEAYNKVRQLIEDVDPMSLDTVDAQLLSDAEANLDALVDSKRVDIHLGEMFALVIFGGITVGLCLLSLPPNVSGWTRLLVDMIAMLISSVIVYLLFHIQDLQQERDEHNLDSDGPRSGLGLRSFARFLPAENQAFNQWISIVIGVAIVMTYAALLGHKWLGWFS